MALWQILDVSHIPTGEVFDDGGWAQPGEPDFNQTTVKTHVSGGTNYNYIGRSPESAPVEDLTLLSL